MRLQLKFITNSQKLPATIDGCAVVPWLADIIAAGSPQYAKHLRESREIKPFVCSRLYPLAETRSFGFTVSSPVADFWKAVLPGLSSPPPLFINDARLQVDDIRVKRFAGGRKFFTLSPILLKDRDGWIPVEDTERARKAVEQNLRRKHAIANGSDTETTIEALAFESPKFVRVPLKGHVFTGIIGRFRLRGAPELIRAAYDLGIGAKNGMGFGCIEACEQ